MCAFGKAAPKESKKYIYVFFLSLEQKKICKCAKTSPPKSIEMATIPHSAFSTKCS